MLSEWNKALLLTISDSSIRALLTAMAVAGILTVFRVRSSGLRHAGWTAVMIAMLLMPVLPYCLPAIPITFSPARITDAADEQPIRVPESFPQTSPIPSTEGKAAVGSTIRNEPDPILPGFHGEAEPQKSNAPILLLTIYSTITAILLGRLLLGWLQMNRLARLAIPVALPIEYCAVAVRESNLSATPFTVGVFFPIVILPPGWRTWSDEKQEAVLVHECAHIKRHDPLVSMLAHLNCCLFWFHPLAWWLERKLATTAEHACDDAAVRAIGEHRRYAAILLDMAEAVRRYGRRFSWQGVGVGGSGQLSSRIERLLRCDLPGEPSRIHKSIVIAGCAAVILLIVACREKALNVVPLQPDPKLVQSQAAEKAESDFDQSARNMSAGQVDELEAALQKNPEDLTTLKKLLTFYEPLDFQVPGKPNQWAPKCTQVIGAQRCIEARRGHILWLIDHHPDNKLASGWLVRMYTTNLDPLPDPAGYEQAKKLWLAKAATPDVNVQILENAANFFEVPDKGIAEKMLLRAQSKDPGKYSSRLGRLYALIIMGANSSMPLNVLRTDSVDQAHSQYAQEIRKKLDASTDPVLLASAAQYLYFNQKKLDFDTKALAKSYYERALQLNPQYWQVRERLRAMNAHDWGSQIAEILQQNKTPKARYDAISALPETERLKYLPRMAEQSYMIGEYEDYSKHDKAAADADFEYAGKFAQDALNLGTKLPNHPFSSPAIYTGNMVLGTLAFKHGDRNTAVRYMLAASHAPASENLDSYLVFYTRLTGQLLKYGERDSVIEFLERIAQLSSRPDQKDYLLESANQIRNGYQPRWYPRETQQTEGRK